MAKKIDTSNMTRMQKKYVEEVAKDKLGLVYEGEIVFKEEK